MGSKGLNADYNWFGNNATNYKSQPKIKDGVNYDTWLFLNATATPTNISVFDTSKIIFLLYNYNSTSQDIFEHFLLGSVNLNITATNGDIDKNSVGLGENITYTSTASGIANVTAAMGTARYTINLMANKLPTQLMAEPVTTVFNVNKNLVVTLKDSKGRAISGVKVSVNLNGVKTLKTDKNGQIKISTKGLVPKSYTAKITFNGDDAYEKSAKSVKVTIKKATPKLTAKSKSFKSVDKAKKFNIALKDNKGAVMKNKKVFLKVNGKKYSAKTNKKGIATFKLTKLTKVGKYKVLIKYGGDKYYNKATAKVTVKVIFKTVSKGSKDKATVVKIQKALKQNGYYLTYAGHYLKVDGKFESCTERSVKEFQRDNGLKVTGKVDYNTAKKLKIVK